MPLVERWIKETDEYVQNDPFTSSHSLEVLQNHHVTSMTGVLKQLETLTSFATDVFDGLIHEATKSNTKLLCIGSRIDAIIQDCSVANSPKLDTSSKCLSGNITDDKDEVLFIPESSSEIQEMSPTIKIYYEKCENPPNLELMDAVSGVEIGTCLKKYSNPDFFMEEWLKEENMRQKRALMEKRERKKIRKELKARKKDGFTTTSLGSNTPHQELLKMKTWRDIYGTGDGLELRNLSNNVLGVKAEQKITTEDHSQLISTAINNEVSSRDSHHSVNNSDCQILNSSPKFDQITQLDESTRSATPCIANIIPKSDGERSDLLISSTTPSHSCLSNPSMKQSDNSTLLSCVVSPPPSKSSAFAPDQFTASNNVHDDSMTKPTHRALLNDILSGKELKSIERKDVSLGKANDSPPVVVNTESMPDRMTFLNEIKLGRKLRNVDQEEVKPAKDFSTSMKPNLLSQIKMKQNLRQVKKETTPKRKNSRQLFNDYSGPIAKILERRQAIAGDSDSDSSDSDNEEWY